MGRTLTHGEAREVYDRIGPLEDLEKVIETWAFRELAEKGRFREASRVLEFGFGTAILAELLFRDYLPPEATYLGLDISPIMADLAKRRLAPWRDRASLRVTDGSMTLDLPEATCDRFVSTFVLDLLSVEDALTLLSEGRRVLRDAGLLCLASLTSGRTPMSRAVTWGWERLHELNPRIVGGCRPVDLRAYLPPGAWSVIHDRVRTAFGLSVEVIVAAKRDVPPQTSA